MFGAPNLRTIDKTQLRVAVSVPSENQHQNFPNWHSKTPSLFLAFSLRTWSRTTIFFSDAWTEISWATVSPLFVSIATIEAVSCCSLRIFMCEQISPNLKFWADFQPILGWLGNLSGSFVLEMVFKFRSDWASACLSRLVYCQDCLIVLGFYLP